MTLVEVLSLIASPALAGILSPLFERMPWFAKLSGTGKLATIVALCVVLAAGATFALQQLSTRPDVVAAVQPYLTAVLPFINMLVTQITHGATKTAQAVTDGAQG